MKDELIRFSRVAMENSMPVIRPLWMLDPSDIIAQVYTSENKLDLGYQN